MIQKANHLSLQLYKVTKNAIGSVYSRIHQLTDEAKKKDQLVEELRSRIKELETQSSEQSVGFYDMEQKLLQTQKTLKSKEIELSMIYQRSKQVPPFNCNRILSH